MLIDVHGHIGSLGGRVTGTDSMRSYIEQCRIHRVLVSNLDAASVGERPRDADEADANLACLEVCRGQAGMTPLYWVRVGRVDSNLHAFAGALDSEPFAGAFFSPPFNRYDADDARLDPYFAVLAKLGKPALVQVGVDDATRPERVYSLARRHPRVPIILCSVGGNVFWKEAVDMADRARHRSDARLLLATSDATAKDVAAAVEALGAECVVYSSDAVRSGERHASRCRETLTALRAALPPADRDKVLGGVAAELFGIAGS